jgi:hypothetical protein
MKIAMGLIVLAVFVGGIAWVVIALRKFQARKAFEREREASFMAEILKAKQAGARSAGGAPGAGAPLAGLAANPPATSAIPGASAAAAKSAASAPAAKAEPAAGAAAAVAAPASSGATPHAKPADPLAAVAESIKAALAAGRGADAAKAFLAVVAQRTLLTLEPPAWEGLGRALLAQGAYLEAAWALHAGAVLANDLAGAQKRLVEVAARAGDAGQAQNALKLYATLLAKYPRSQYADFVRANMKQEERKLAKG